MNKSDKSDHKGRQIEQEITSFIKKNKIENSALKKIIKKLNGEELKQQK